MLFGWSKSLAAKKTNHWNLQNNDMLGVFVYISEVLIILSLPYLIISYDGHYKLVQTHTSPAVGQGEGVLLHRKFMSKPRLNGRLQSTKPLPRFTTIKDWKWP